MSFTGKRHNSKFLNLSIRGLIHEIINIGENRQFIHEFIDIGVNRQLTHGIVETVTDFMTKRSRNIRFGVVFFYHKVSRAAFVTMETGYGR